MYCTLHYSKMKLEKAVIPRYSVKEVLSFIKIHIDVAHVPNLFFNEVTGDKSTTLLKRDLRV